MKPQHQLSCVEWDVEWEEVQNTICKMIWKGCWKRSRNIIPWDRIKIMEGNVIFTYKKMIKRMKKAVDKELISHLLKLETDQQKKVLVYIKDLLTNEEMDRRAETSEKAIKSGKVKSFDQFNSDFENWKAQKRRSML